MNIIKTATFLKSVSDFTGYKGFNVPEIIIVGRSNVGKSSIINMLANNKKLAKVSATQGKTKLANFFMFNNEFVLVDLPGYGYAEAGKSEQNRWKNMMDGYFKVSKNLKMAILLIDIRHKPTEQDIEMLEYFVFNGIAVTVVATKYDKIKRSEKMQKLSCIANTFNMGTGNIVLTSSESSFGKQELIDRIYQFI